MNRLPIKKQVHISQTESSSAKAHLITQKASKFLKKKQLYMPALLVKKYFNTANTECRFNIFT